MGLYQRLSLCLDKKIWMQIGMTTIAPQSQWKREVGSHLTCETSEIVGPSKNDTLLAYRLHDRKTMSNLAVSLV